MPTTVSIGASQDPDPQNAALQACIQVKNQINTLDNDLVLVFASPSYISSETPAVIARTLRPKHMLGSSTGGIILPQGIINRGIAVVCVNSTDINIGIAAIKDMDTQNPQTAGFDLARKATNALNASRREVFITFTQGVEKNFTTFIRGIKESLGGVFAVVGAISSDDSHYQKCSQIFQDQILQKSAVGLLLGGSTHLGLGYKHGFKPLGKPRAITAVDGYIIRSIDHKPAVEIYKHFLGQEDPGISSLVAKASIYPLGIYVEEYNQYLLRNVIDILADGSIVCHEGVPQGAQAHLMISNPNYSNYAAIEAAKAAKASLGDKTPHLVLVFDSMTRCRIMGRNTLGLIQNIRDILGKNVPVAGMCSFGEIGPFNNLNNIKNTYLHNAGIMIAAIA